MPLPLVFRRIAQTELDESVAWYDNKRAGFGREFRIEIDKQLRRIANQPQRFSQVRGNVRRVVLKRFPIQYISCPKSRG